MRWTGAKLEILFNASKPNEGDKIFAVSGNRILVAAVYHKYLYSSDLKQRREIPIRVLTNMFPRGDRVGEWNDSDWKVFRIGPALTLAKKGLGELLSIADDVIVYR